VRRPGPRQGDKGVQQRRLQPVRAGDRGRDPIRGQQPLPEAFLPSRKLPITKQRRRAFRILPKQEDQPGNARLARRLILQLGIRHLRTVPNRWPVTESGNQDIHIRGPHRLLTRQGRLLIAGREIGHISDNIASSAHRRLRRGDERATGRKPAQLGRVRQKHPKGRRMITRHKL
jgi:hypothetical protein